MSITSNGWKPDVLGSNFERLELDLGSDGEGPLVATLVRHVPQPAGSFRPAWLRLGPVKPAADTDVLYIHGWTDYFFQEHLAEYWRSQGARFFALDLRKYGRSLREGQSPGFIDDLSAYDRDIEAALAAMGHSLNGSAGRKLVMMGHSTGGLTLSLWLARNPGRANALVLNSPWLEYQLTSTLRQVVEPMMDIQAKVAPRARQINPDLGFYYRSIARARGGEWEFNEDWRPEKSFPVRTAWLKAILAGHTRVAAGLGIEIPILTLLSDHSLFLGKWSEKMREADIVIDVETTALRATRLGRQVTIARVPRAMHDVTLSRPDVRADAFKEITRWISSYL